MSRPKKKAPDQDPVTSLGTFTLGAFNVHVSLAWDEYGGRFHCAPDETGPPRIVVGMRDGFNANTLAILWHEALELELARAGHRYTKDFEQARNSAAYWFMIDHQEFAEAVSRCAAFAHKAWPAIAKAWKERQKSATK